MSRYLYSAFGLTIASELECPELLPGKGKPDVTISYGKVPDNIANPNKEGFRYSISDRQYLLRGFIPFYLKSRAGWWQYGLRRGNQYVHRCNL